MRKLMVFSRRESARTGQTKNYRDRIEMTRKKEGGWVYPAAFFHVTGILPVPRFLLEIVPRQRTALPPDKRSPFY